MKRRHLTIMYVARDRSPGYIEDRAHCGELVARFKNNHGGISGHDDVGIVVTKGKRFMV